MKDQTASYARRVEVTDPIATAWRYDYADAFAIDLPAPDTVAPAVWVRAGLDATPPAVDWIVRLLGMRPSADPLDDWQIRESDPEVIHLEMSLPMMHVVVVGRRVGPARRMFTSALTYRRPVLARLLWTVIAPAHRRYARRLISSKIPAQDANREANPVDGA